jgi:hypothetical protein
MTPLKKALLAGGLVATTLTGGALGATIFGTAGAAESTTTTVADSQQAPVPPTDGQAPPAPPAGQAPQPPRGPHQANGITETPLTGSDYDKAVAAATGAVTDGTVERVETDAEGDAYEVHMTKADGSRVTVKLDESFNVVRTEDGPMGGGPHGGPRPDGAAPQRSSTSTSDTQG